MLPSEDQTYQETMTWLNQSQNTETLKAIRRGIEKESLRVDGSGELSQTPHPTSLGAALTHPHITTDYSEALLELITGTHTQVRDTLAELEQIHQWVFHNLGKEYLWTQSMPCRLGDNQSIPIAEYGESNLGKMKHLYRKGLGVRYGRKMQTIAGIHYNFSLPESFWLRYAQFLGKQPSDRLQPFISEQYFALIRNAHRLGWLTLFLFGSSPCIDDSFYNHDHPQLKPHAKYSRYAPLGTSLRMSDLGYKNSAQSGLNICYNTLETYINTLNHAIQTPSAEYERLGQYDHAGARQQINTHQLQIENEYYGSIRPKRVTLEGERPTLALARRGVEYVELRSIDLDPFDPIGISSETCCFIEVFLLYALLSPSPPLSQTDLSDIQHNLTQTIFYGRSPTGLKSQGKTVPLLDWAQQLLQAMEPIAQCLSEALDEPDYIYSVRRQQDKLKQPDLLPCKRVINELTRSGGQEGGQEYLDFGMHIAEQNKNRFLQRPLTQEHMQIAQAAATASQQTQTQLEQSHQEPFETYLQHYFSSITPK